MNPQDEKQWTKPVPGYNLNKNKEEEPKESFISFLINNSSAILGYGVTFLGGTMVGAATVFSFDYWFGVIGALLGAMMLAPRLAESRLYRQQNARIDRLLAATLQNHIASVEILKKMHEEYDEFVEAKNIGEEE